ncbi:hypothetical protein BC833DRAFT_597009 [Globomyces pollinis-pini]|nr:hypothetical protein BC833DRAFT_597009 [Globomyces pollinis-pini]
METAVVDSLLLIDLDAYNYISAFLFQGMGTELFQVQTMDLQQRQNLFRNDLLANHAFFLYLKRSELLPIPTLKRLNIAAALLAIEELARLRNTQLDPAPAEILKHHQRISSCYLKLIDFLQGDSLTIQEKSESIVTNLLIEFKTLYFLADLAGGYMKDGIHHQYVKEEAKQRCSLLLSINEEDSQNFSPDLLPNLNETIKNRQDLIFEWIDTGEVALDPNVSIENEQTLLKCLISIAISANTDMQPILHPSYHINSSPRIQQISKNLLESLRKSQSTAGKQDPLGLVIRKPKKRAVPFTPVEEGQRKRKAWTDAETEALRRGIERYGNDWVTIQREFKQDLIDRHPVSLKDRARSMRRILTRAGKPLGVWGGAGKDN